MNCTTALFPGGTFVPRLTEIEVKAPALMGLGKAATELMAGTTVMLVLPEAPAYVAVMFAVTVDETGMLPARKLQPRCRQQARYTCIAGREFCRSRD